MDTNFEATMSGVGTTPSAGAPAEVVFEAPRVEVEPEEMGMASETSPQAEDFESESEAIMDLSGTPHAKLERLAEGKVEPVAKEPEVKANKKVPPEAKEPEESLEKKILSIQQQLLTLMLMQMNKEKKSEFSSKELVAKIKQLIEEAEGDKDKSPQIMSALMGMLMMAFAVGEKGVDSLEKQLGAN